MIRIDVDFAKVSDKMIALTPVIMAEKSSSKNIVFYLIWLKAVIGISISWSKLKINKF